jgi:O-acetyl-ADP-ribose deacetylase (regulator of RNase III)
MDKIELIKGDITLLKTDAIVNAANTSLLGGGGVDRAIHRAAGNELLQECKKLNGCKTGDAKVTSGYNLPSKYVIHTVGPVWHGGGSNEMALLKSCYKRCMEEAIKLNIKSIAFPNISTGVYGFPKNLAAKIAIDEVRSNISGKNELEKIVFCCFDEENYNLYNEILNIG